MSKIVVQQPNGKFTIFSTCTDTPEAFEMSEKEVCEYMAKEAYESTYESMKMHFKLHKYKNEDFFKDKFVMWDEMDEPTKLMFKKIFGVKEMTREEFYELD